VLQRELHDAKLKRELDSLMHRGGEINPDRFQKHYTLGQLCACRRGVASALAPFRPATCAACVPDWVAVPRGLRALRPNNVCGLPRKCVV
jgi:hypothetical protein